MARYTVSNGHEPVSEQFGKLLTSTCVEAIKSSGKGWKFYIYDTMNGDGHIWRVGEYIKVAQASYLRFCQFRIRTDRDYRERERRSF